MSGSRRAAICAARSAKLSTGLGNALEAGHGFLVRGKQGVGPGGPESHRRMSGLEVGVAGHMSGRQSQFSGGTEGPCLQEWIVRPVRRGQRRAGVLAVNGRSRNADPPGNGTVRVQQRPDLRARPARKAASPGRRSTPAPPPGEAVPTSMTASHFSVSPLSKASTPAAKTSPALRYQRVPSWRSPIPADRRQRRPSRWASSRESRRARSASR